MRRFDLKVFSKPLIRSKSAQDAVGRLPHISQAPTITIKSLTLLYSLIEGEDEAHPPSPKAEKSSCIKKKSKILI